jgi:hypothetical protein
MKNNARRLKVSIALLASLVVLEAAACDVCGAFFGVTPYDNQSSVTLLHRYRLFSASNQSGLPAGAYRLSNPGYSPLHGNTHDSVTTGFESFKVIELRGRWFIHKRWELSGILPVVQNRVQSDGKVYRLSGLGDASIYVSWHPIVALEESVKHRLQLAIGMKLPTGNADHTMPSGIRHSLLVQPGTGAADVFGFAQYTIGIKRWGMMTNIQGRYSGENAVGEQLCPAFMGTWNVFYRLGNENRMVLPQVQMYYERMSGVQLDNIIQEGTMMHVLMAGVGADVYINRLAVNVGWHRAIFEETASGNPEAKFRATIGVTWNFNQTKYLLKTKEYE